MRDDCLVQQHDYFFFRQVCSATCLFIFGRSGKLTLLALIVSFFLGRSEEMDGLATADARWNNRKKKKEKDLPTPWETCMMQVSRTGGVEARDPAQGQFSACDD